MVQGAAATLIVALHGSPAVRATRAVVAIAVTAAVLLAARRTGRWWPGIAVVVFGLLGAAIGAALGAGHVLEGDADVTGLAGLVVLASGLVLLVGGAAMLIGAARRWWKLLAVPIAYVVVELAAIPIIMGVYGTDPPRAPLAGPTPATFGLHYRTVSLRATDGVALAGWYVASRNGAAVVVVPGAGSNRDAVLPQGSVLAKHGYGVLFLDNRGHGGSGGTANDFGWYGNQDLEGAVAWLDRRPDVTGGRVAVVGESMGGEEAIGAIGADPRVRAVVAEGATGRVVADRAWLAHDMAGYLRRAEAWVTYTTAALLSGTGEPAGLATSLRAAAPRPVLLIAGRDELRADRYFRRGSPGNVQLLALPEVAHTAGLQTHPALWTQRVLSFLDASLGVTR